MVSGALTSLSSGATFFRADLHIHSFEASYDVKDSAATPIAIVEAAKREGLAIISLTDHNEISNVTAAVEAGRSHGVVVIPGVELSTPEGHLLCYAPTPDALERFFNRLQIADRRTSSCRCQTGALQCLEMIGAEGGFGVLAHVDLDGAFEANMPRFTPAKLDILCHPALEGFEVARPNCPIIYDGTDVDEGRRGAANERIRRLHLGSGQYLARVVNSDAHTLSAVGRNANRDRRITRYKMECPTFEGLRLALKTADTRVRIEEGLPAHVPTVKSIHFQGAFLDGEAINFSPNLTCIIGGRGSGKSTVFESICLLGGSTSDEVTVIDSDVWPDILSLLYVDEAGQEHSLARSKYGDVENLDDPVSGSTAFPVESYRQGATNEISKRVQDDPLALLTFLDRLIQVESEIDAEDNARGALIELAPKIAKAAVNVDKISGYEKELKLKVDQLQRLRDDKGEEVIKLQQQLEGEKQARNEIERALAKLSASIGSEATAQVIAEIRNSVEGYVIELGAPEAARIQKDTSAYETSVNGSTDALRKLTSAFVASVRIQISEWKKKEADTSEQIERKKQELLKHGIRLDMPFIQKLVSDEARARENLKQAKAWAPELKRLRREYDGLMRQRWSARQDVARHRTAFAVRSSEALKGTLSDLFVTLKFEESALSPEAERLIIDAMGWRTLQHLKARALIETLTLPVLLECLRRRDVKSVTALRSVDTKQAIFSHSEAEMLFDRISDPELLSQLESAAVHDRPRLSVTKRLVEVAGKSRFVPRDFKRLSLGQQQSVLLALMLTSESCAPLIVDQPEDNLDSEFIYKTLVPVIRSAKERRQVILVTHNANIAVLGDAELIVALKATAEKATVVTRGSIDHGETCEAACNILEGSREAFDRRAAVYGIGLTG
ncbi:MAG: TrlF family AAA-like ATPase [Luteibacter sp.]|uniref:TrlF family AAA-like ATPase n=1 Tax=Luteibacter sp. TaxID=1886636 RepID=UPI002809FCE8|nr:AAA family ATPase [Luteibacter sp.]MDQ7994975.1 PHP domain-containing protein [Luteibacter sp.]MDQ8047509.1 PHP domain-containing protein [Luteibacter sp.]